MYESKKNWGKPQAIKNFSAWSYDAIFRRYHQINPFLDQIISASNWAMLKVFGFLLTLGFYCHAIHNFFLRFDTIFGLKMVVKSGLEKNILKFHGGLQRYLLTCQANSAFLGRFFCTGQQQLWRPSWNFKIFFSRPLFTIIFKPKMVSNLRKNFLCIVWHQKPTMIYLKNLRPKIGYLKFQNDFFQITFHYHF